MPAWAFPRRRGHIINQWSPLASGLLTGKYNQGIPAGIRAAMEGYGWLKESVITPERMAKVKQLQPIAGASRAEQVTENMKALDVASKLTPEILERIDEVLGNRPE